MDIDATKDFKRPRAQVLEKFRDPARFESVMRDMKIETERTSEPPSATWACSVQWREEPRRFAAGLVETAAAETMVMQFTSDLADAQITMDFYDLPDGGCRVIGKGVVSARTIMAKLALQSMRLVRGKAEERLTRLIFNMGRP
ncbi:hypothetical protein [Pararhodobacter zhoushanensis]|uniref:SCP2 domain-containing protein n=1 Tax=Pararhodobacter zhoushanensis TaxID=2479545 RepID=A0ABT3H4V6_9RHOB|nr:hypothetical protein [Pararhodobacter zhoushanensis]MCW1934837.1 hypothetical protein [Pararhodobacter zhoushanensis]